ncbi:sensor histidine kinase [Natronorubrum tibetense]|uniref:histidine kinase n=1 Tax=Natronorubrum tibetense GA33 TaxID=1114856 RepID=L9VHC1_9EURY|nr:ATP-binding protein [Natronorubrum tibetense]ELY36461.1 multi-sensor signal transduction histidine kinase [Natronorubrum tibetense GA33]
MADGSERSNSQDGDAASTVYERITDAVFALDEEWQFTFLNAQAEQVLERSETELLGTAIWGAFPDAVDSMFQREYERAMAAQEPVTFQEFSESLGIWLEIRAYPSETGLTVYFRDITERILRKERLQKREQALHDAYEVIADPQRAFRDQIDGLLAVVRRTIGTEYATLSRVHEDADEYIFEAVDTPTDADIEAGDTAPLSQTSCERAVSSEETLVLRDIETDTPELADRAATAEWGISCYLGTPITVDGEVYGTFCFYDMEARSEAFTDWEVTFVELLGNWVSYELERERYQRKLEASNERLEQFAYTASHDLQEPLRMVSSYLGLIERQYGDELDADGEEFLEYAVDGAERMRDMIDGLLAYSRIETRGDPFEPVDLNAVLAAVRDDLQFRIEEAGADLSAASLPRVHGDGEQLRQVFQNLLTNALTYSGDETPRIYVDAERTGGEWTISVSDAGIGIDPDDQERIFDVFERLHSHEEHAGTGIGLALCERIVERHGGEIWVDSEPGDGTTFLFTLPAAETANR